jgi:hypothetical protein
MCAEEFENYENFDPKNSKKCKIADFDKKISNLKNLLFFIKSKNIKYRNFEEKFKFYDKLSPIEKIIII